MGANEKSKQSVIQPLNTAPVNDVYCLLIGTNFKAGAAVAALNDTQDGWHIDDGKNFEIYVRNMDKVIGWMPLPEIGATDLKPISTHPTDGSYFLIYGAQFDGHAAVVRWNGNWWDLDNGEYDEITLRREDKLTGWYPLPAEIQELQKKIK